MKCRFAPSPTGLLHVGNVRSALLNWAYSKKNNGKFILRIDDTDLSRSTNGFENKIKENLTWLGVNWDKTFNQSDRIENYQLKIEKLKKEGRLYPCFETAEELSLKKKSLLSSGKPPIYDRTSLLLNDEDIDEKIKLGQKPHWRFKLNDSIIEWNDLIKGNVKFDPKNLSDPILIREDGSLLYHLPSVIDDIEEEISHIIRGEDHISNTAFHIQIFEALGNAIPKFAHHPFLTDQDGKGFGKRMGSLSIENLKAEGYEDVAIINYLINIGSSKDIKPETIKNKIIENFDIKNISTSSAIFSEVVLKSLNADILKNYKFEQVSKRLNFVNSHIDLEKLWIFSHNNIFFIQDIIIWSKLINETFDISEFNISEDFIQIAVESIPEEPFNYDSWDAWTKFISEKTGLKGRNLFMPLRLILTGKDKGPELKNFLPLLDKQILLRKFGKA
ncbi:MAG: glutamate--tRNA ligase [Candidatus Marinimicrobia bacterium]|nr:glutamate--tRNA ligase [Candidatus Neomarinimicrobiota bacterium]|tara:strand:- start:10625 stop:11959 length:1335 start_codon:yes stop_codon:yes gene_type:complete